MFVDVHNYCNFPYSSQSHAHTVVSKRSRGEHTFVNKRAGLSTDYRTPLEKKSDTNIFFSFVRFISFVSLKVSY